MAQEPGLFSEPEDIHVKNHQLEMNIQLHTHSVSLIQIFPRNNSTLPEIKSIKLNSFSGINSNESILSWKVPDNSYQFHYEVYYSDNPDHQFNKIKHPRLTSGALAIYKPGYYQVRAINPWDIAGQFSPHLLFK